MRVNYWTTAPLEPLIEAVSKEVYELATHFRGRIFAVNPHISLRVEQRARVLGFHPKWDVLLRLGIPWLERSGDVNHVYAEISPWLFHKTLRRRPVVLTIASEKGQLVPEFLQRCASVVAQTYSMARRLQQCGLPSSRVRLIYPGIDLSRFMPRQEGPARGRARVLLATFPRTAEELESRGVLFLLQAAKQYPEIQFSLVSRPWRSGGTAAERVNQLITADGLKNVTVIEGVQSDMRELYMQHDFTVIPYTTPDGGKECPRSLVETLACGVPVLISEIAPFAPFIREHDCGQVFSLTTNGFAAAVDAAQSRYATLGSNAVTQAHANFDLSGMIRTYAELYEAAR